jgi:hypothetical protein
MITVPFDPPEGYVVMLREHRDGLRARALYNGRPISRISNFIRWDNVTENDPMYGLPLPEYFWKAVQDDIIAHRRMQLRR